MASSILTNTGAMTALQSLQMTQKSLLDTQNRISTGLKVNSAKDNAATWAVATTIRTDIANFKQLSENLSTGSSVVGTAQSGAEQITSLIGQIKAKITAAQDPSKDKTQIQADIKALVDQVSSTADSAAFNGVNLLNNSVTQRFTSAVNSVAGVSTPSYIEVAGQDLTLTGGLADLASIDVTDRGTSLFNKANPSLTPAAAAALKASQDAMGTKQTNFTVATPATDTPGNFVVNYTDKDGVAQSVTVALAATANADDFDLQAAALNADKNFSKLFYATGASGGTGITLQAANRAVETGSFAITGIADTANAPVLASATTTTTSESFTFQNVPLKAGETFQLDYSIGGVAKSVKLQVSNNVDGTLLNTAADGTKTFALNSANVSKYDAVGSDIAAAVRTALTATLYGTPAFKSGTASTSQLSVGGTGASVTITSMADAANNAVTKFRPPATDYATILASADKALSVASNAAAVFGTAGTRIDTQKTFTDKLVDTLTTGVGALVDADMSAEAARLQALQVQQQLGTQALSIANQAPQSILSLFK